MKTEQIERLFKECPKTVKEVQKYLLKSVEELPELPEFAKIKEEFDNKGLSMVKFYMNMGPRFLYEFFDERGLYIGISPFPPDSEENKFYWKIKYKKGDNTWDENSIGVSGVSLPNRVEAEVDAFEAAFKILEGRL